jgi:signal transduction histidine kinase
MLRGFFRSFYWKLSAVFLIVLTLVGTAYIFLTFSSTGKYFAETNQRLNASVAQHIVDDIQLFPDGKPNLKAMNDLFHSVMVVNPSVEVYLLDAEGKILTFDAPKEKVKLTSVSLEPIHEFLASGGKKYVLGDNPRDMHKPKVFSAAPATMNGMVYGYIYVILGGETYDSIAERIRESYILTLGLRGLLVSLVAAGVIGLVALAFVTRKLRRMTASVKAFKEGDYSQRVTTTSNDELDQLGSAFNEMAATIQSNVEELSKADALRRELIANVSHDLRTPLASVQGYIETVMMKDETLTAEERLQYLKTIFTSTERLSKLVQELFELSKLEAKQSQPKPEPFSMPELVNDLTMKFAPQAEASGISISADVPKNIPLVNGDIGMIERAMQNLIENAIAYTPRGGQVKVVLQQRNRKVQTQVEDTGVGIAEKDIPLIFNRFYQARTRKNSNAGAGLGLAITKKILEAHGEDIRVESRVHVGTKFVFELPAA